MLTSVVKIQVLRVMSQMYLTIHITMVFAGCTIVCLVAQYQGKNGQTLYYLWNFLLI